MTLTQKVGHVTIYAHLTLEHLRRVVVALITVSSQATASAIDQQHYL